MNKWTTIGAKLVLAFTGTTVLLTVVSVITWLTWNRLDDQISYLLESSIPKYNTSYLLESRSSEIRSQVQLLPKLTNKVELKQQIAELFQEITLIKQTLSTKHAGSTEPNETQPLSELYKTLNAQLTRYSQLVLLRVEQRRKIKKLEEQIDWLHHDIAAELTPIRQELHWLIKRDDNTLARSIALKQLRTIEDILDLESNLYSMTSELIQAKQLGQIHNAIKVIQYKLQELVKNSDKLSVLPSSIAYQQLVQELATLLGPKGMFYHQLVDLVTLNERTTLLRHNIDKQLDDIHQHIGLVVQLADNSFFQFKDQTASLVSYGNHVLLVCFSVSILMSLFLTYYFINRRIVARLTSLSTSIDAITKGDLSHPIRVDGNDEIGRLSKKLIEYGESVKEIQRTNAISLINNTSAALLTCDLAGHVESANLSARRLFSKPPFLNKKMLEHNFLWAYFSPNNQSALNEVFSEQGNLFTKGSDDITLCITCNPACYLHFDFHLFSHGQLRKVIITITDITQQALNTQELERRVAEKTSDLTEKNQRLSMEIIERKQTEQNLKQTQDDLIQAAKMAVMGQTMTSLAHELNQPLNAMSSYVFSAKLSCDEGKLDAANSAIDHIEGLSQRMSQVINSLRSFARKPDLEQNATNISVSDVAVHAITLVNTTAKRQLIEIDNQLESHLITYGNALALEQVMVNLLVNSCDAIAESDLPSKTIRIFTLPSNLTHLRIAFEDSGLGFDENIVSKLFTPFTTTKEVGLGLGLNISQSLVEKYNGHIFLASSLNKGALVILELPHAKH